MTTFNPNLHAVPGDDEGMPLDDPRVVAEVSDAFIDLNLIGEWIGATGWRSFQCHDLKAMMAAHGSDEQVLAIADMHAELVEAYEADQANWLAARERVIKRDQDDAAEHAADARLAA